MLKIGCYQKDKDEKPERYINNNGLAKFWYKQRPQPHKYILQ